MSSSIFRDGMPHGLVAPMFNEGFGIETDLVDPLFASALFSELRANDMYYAGEAQWGGSPGVHHDERILESLHRMPLLAECRDSLNDAITEVSGFNFEHLTYLSVRACPVGEMSSQIHRNDNRAGPWLVSLVIAGGGSFNIYSDDVIGPGEEIELNDDDTDPEPIVSSEMSIGDAWGIYSKERSAPHAGGKNTSLYPKVLLLLYGWCARDKYPNRGPRPFDTQFFQ